MPEPSKDWAEGYETGFNVGRRLGVRELMDEIEAICVKHMTAASTVTLERGNGPDPAGGIELTEEESESFMAAVKGECEPGRHAPGEVDGRWQCLRCGKEIREWKAP